MIFESYEHPFHLTNEFLQSFTCSRNARRETSGVKFCHDTGGNAKEFRACDAQEGLVHLKNLWSKAWKEQGTESLVSQNHVGRRAS